MNDTYEYYKSVVEDALLNNTEEEEKPKKRLVQLEIPFEEWEFTN